MSLFFNYDKPGRGISKEEAEERNYFKILGRKLGLIIKANLLFFGVNIILLVALLFPVISLLFNAYSDATIEHYRNILAGKQFMSPFPFLILALLSPTFAGLTYLCRNFAKQEHVFLASDFFEQTKKNWKQSIVAGFILSAFFYLYLTALFFYWNSGAIVLRAFILLLGILLIYTSFYVFPQIVTFELSLAKIFKNAMIFAIGNLPSNTLAFLSLAAIHILLMLGIPLIWVLLMSFFLIAFSTYTVNFVTWSAISKYMIKDRTDKT